MCDSHACPKPPGPQDRRFRASRLLVYPSRLLFIQRYYIQHKEIAMPNDPSVRPYIPASAQLPELTPRALLMGVILGMVFGASSLYLVLKVGLTVSASIPVAVIAITLFGLAKKAGGKDSSIL
jgi:hypothetical protein